MQFADKFVPSNLVKNVVRNGHHYPKMSIM